MCPNMLFQKKNVLAPIEEKMDQIQTKILRSLSSSYEHKNELHV